jgi:serine/threonine protein kinase
MPDTWPYREASSSSPNLERTLPSPSGDRLRLFLQICEAVSYGHEQGVVHRDLKPSNLLITEPIDTSPARARLIDFGVA